MNEEEKTNAAEATQQTQKTQEQAAAVAAAEGAQEAAPVEAEVEEAAAEPKSRDLFYERIRTNFPDSNYDEDEDGYYRDALSRMDALEKDSKTLKDLTSKLETRLGADPQEAEVMLDWLDGVDIRTAIARHMGAEALSAPEEGSEEYESWKKAGDDRRKELDDMKAKVDEYRTNAEASAAALKEFAQENGLDEEQAAELERYIAEEFLPNIYAGKLGKDFYGFIQHGRNYDADIEGAREQGRVDGRNEKIEAEKKHLEGSGLPSAKSGGNVAEEVDAKPANKTVDFLTKMAKRRV